MREAWTVEDVQQAATREAEPAEGGFKQEARTQQSSYGIQNEVETFFLPENMWRVKDLHMLW